MVCPKLHKLKQNQQIYPVTKLFCSSKLQKDRKKRHLERATCIFPSLLDPVARRALLKIAEIRRHFYVRTVRSAVVKNAKLPSQKAPCGAVGTLTKIRPQAMANESMLTYHHLGH